jgi:GR25 family glycosyltransferase involved in LPS biosynthesis
MNNILYSYDRQIESAYIITVKNHSVSERMSMRCQNSCKEIGMPYKVWDAFDGTSGRIHSPEHLKNAEHMSWFKQLDHELSITEVACALSHISLWCHCVTIDKPIVILEHDAIMLKKLSDHPLYNSILYLGNIEQYKKGWPVLTTPTHATAGNNYHFICRAHAYAIDPQVAKNMVSHVLKFGIHESLDMMLRADIFNIVEFGVYAYDEADIQNTTIVGRKKTAEGKER